MNQKLAAVVLATVMVGSMVGPTSLVGVAVAGNAGNTGTLMGNVANSGDVGVGNADVFIYNDANNIKGPTITDNSGDYTINNVKQSNYTLVADHPNYAEAIERNVNITAGKTTTLDVTLQKPTTVSGTVTDTQGNPLDGLNVLLDGGERYHSARTQNGGKFSEEVPSGTYGTMIISPKRGFVLKNPQTIDTTTGDQTVTLEAVKPSITSKSISVTSGSQGVETGKIGVDAKIQSGMMFVKVNNTSTSTRKPNELKGLGVDQDTTFEISITAKNYTPNSLLWGARNVSWSTNKNGNTVDITVTTKAAHMAGIQTEKISTIGPMLFRKPENVNWPSGAADKANIGWKRTVYFGLYDLSNMPSAVRNRSP